LHEDYEEKIEEIQKKHLQAVKEKALLKLEKDKAQKRVAEIQTTIKLQEEKVQKQIDASMKKQRMGGRLEQHTQVKGQNTPWPEDARDNPYLREKFETPFNERASC
jgi:regulator of replication initiation timing